MQPTAASIGRLLLTIGASLAGSYLKTDPELREPNLQLHFLPFMPGEKGWDLAKFSEQNESNTVVLAEPKGDRPIAVVKQIVGLIARRIIFTAKEGEVLQRYEPKPWVTAVPPNVAQQTRDMMVGVVAGGSGTRAQIPGVAVAGKTGTAQTGLDKSHVWFIAFAPAEAPRVAVAVMLEDQPSSNEFTGGALAAPIAAAVMRAALAS